MTSVLLKSVTSLMVFLPFLLSLSLSRKSVKRSFFSAKARAYSQVTIDSYFQGRAAKYTTRDVTPFKSLG